MLLAGVKNIEEVINKRTNDLSEPLEMYYKIATILEQSKEDKYAARAAFIRQQCENLSGKDIFDKYRSLWGIPDFEEELVSVNDFTRGFLYTFRDHTTSWSDNNEAKRWFLTSYEAWFIRQYEFWTWDNKIDECIDVKKGSYKEILSSLLEEEDYEVLISSAFTKAELDDFIKSFKEEDGDCSFEVIKDYIVTNINYTI